MLPKKNKEKNKIKISGLLQEAVYLFKAKNLEKPELEAELLLSYILKKDRLFLLTKQEKNINAKTAAKFITLVKKRLAGWSSALLLKNKEFFSLNFLVNKNVLIPRPETEILVDTILKQVISDKKTLIMDIGTGSGAIIISLFKNLHNPEKKLSFYASDKSLKALNVAHYNAKKYKATINFLSGDLLQPFLPIFKKIKPKNIIITANLPYLKPAEMHELSIKKEPKMALLSGSDGLWHYKRLFSQLKKFINNDKDLINIFLICEINPEQALQIKKIAKINFPKAKMSLKNDYTNRPRFFILEF